MNYRHKLAAKAVKVQYSELPHLVLDRSPHPPDGFAQPMKPEVQGDPDGAFAKAAAVVQATYSMPVITHCCLEPHGSVVTWRSGALDVHISTQSVSGIVTQMSKALGVPASQNSCAIRVWKAAASVRNSRQTAGA